MLSRRTTRTTRGRHLTTAQTEAEGRYALAEAIPSGFADALRAFRHQQSPDHGATVSVEQAMRVAEPGYAMLESALTQTHDPFQQARLHQMRVNLGELVANGNVGAINQAMAAIQAAAAQAAAKAEQQGGAMETKAQKMERLWGEIQRDDKEIDGDLERMRRQGLISEETYERLKREHDAAYEHPVGSKEWRAANRTYNADLQGVTQTAVDATAPGSSDHSLAVRTRDEVNARTVATDSLGDMWSGEPQRTAAASTSPTRTEQGTQVSNGETLSPTIVSATSPAQGPAPSAHR